MFYKIKDFWILYGKWHRFIGHVVAFFASLLHRGGGQAINKGICKFKQLSATGIIREYDMIKLLALVCLKQEMELSYNALIEENI